MLSHFEVPHTLRIGRPGYLASSPWLVTMRNFQSIANMRCTRTSCPTRKDPFDRILSAQAIVERITLPLVADATN